MVAYACLSKNRSAATIGEEMAHRAISSERMPAAFFLLTKELCRVSAAHGETI